MTCLYGETTVLAYTAYQPRSSLPTEGQTGSHAVCAGAKGQFPVELLQWATDESMGTRAPVHERLRVSSVAKGSGKERLDPNATTVQAVAEEYATRTRLLTNIVG